MDKIFTQQTSTYIKTLLIAVMVCFTLVLQPATANAVYDSPIGIQAKNIKCYPNPAVSFINFIGLLLTGFNVNAAMLHFLLNLISARFRMRFLQQIHIHQIALNFPYKFHPIHTIVD